MKESSSENYCYEKGVPQGSAFYFSLQGIGGAQRDCIAAIAAFYQELTDVIFECQDTHLAYTKFNWWRSEVVKIDNGLENGSSSDHPVMVVLQKHFRQFNLAPETFLDLIAGIEQDLNLSPFTNFEDLTLQIIHTAGMRERLIATVMQLNSDENKETIYSLALITELTAHIQNLRKDVKRGLIFFSSEELSQCQVTPVMLQTLKTTPEIKNLLALQAEKIERIAAKVETELTHEIRSKLSSLLIRAEIAKTTLIEIKNSDFRVLESFITLTPLRRWWISFKFKIRIL